MLYLQQAVAEIARVSSTDAVTEYHRVHSWLVKGYRGVTYLDDDGQERPRSPEHWKAKT